MAVIKSFREFMQDRLGNVDKFYLPFNAADFWGDDHFNMGVPYPDDVDPQKLAELTGKLGELDGEILRGGGEPTPEQKEKRDALVTAIKELRYSYVDPKARSPRREPIDPRTVLQ